MPTNPDQPVDNQPVDNLEAAMHHEAELIEPTVNRAVGTPGAPAPRQVLFRATASDHDRWKQAAAHLGVSMSEFIRQVCNEKAAELLDCSHPLNMRRWYPWAQFCNKCGQRLPKDFA